MPLRLNVGISKKVGQPKYGSLGASCNVEVELDQSMIFADLESFQERVMHAYSACRQAVNDELARAQGPPGGQTAHGPAMPNAPNGSWRTPSNGQNGHRASQKQLDYIQQLAGQISDSGVRQVETLAEEMFDKPLADLSSLEASSLITTLKEIRAERINLQAAFNDGADAY